jgi:phosphoribosylformimino-5-aminoimidazole carboxamide ribotide isomerase
VIVPCIDLQNGRAVQLVRGKRLALSVDDVMGLLVRFERFPVLHVIDLDAAMRTGSNGRWVRRLCERGKMRVRVGGGIRTAARAKQVLSWGAEKIIVGSAAFKDGAVNHAFLRELRRSVGRKRVVVALDTRRGKVVVRGWKESLGVRPKGVMRELEPYCSEFMATYVDNEGTMRGTDLAWFRELRRATKLPITAAGGIRSLHEVRELEKLGMNAAVGMAIYRGKLLKDLKVTSVAKTGH